MSKARILVVEDEAIVAEDLSQKLSRLDYEVAGVTASGEEAWALARQHGPDLVLMDIRLEGPMDGVEAARAIRQTCDIPVIYLTAHSDPSTLQRAKLTEPFGFILKPFETPQLETQIQMALYKHQADREVHRQREWLRVTLRSIGDAVITTDAEGKVTSLNPVAEELTGWKTAEALNRPLAEVFNIINETTRQPAFNPVGRVLQEGKIVGLANHTALISRQGKETAIEDSAAPIKDAQGRILGVVMVFHDVTEKRQAEAALARSKEELEVLVAERTAKLRELVSEMEHFSYTITHDMRAPLRGMQGFAELMAETCSGCTTQDALGFLQRIRTSAGRMDALITDALNYSKAVRQELVLGPVDVGALLRGMLDSYPEFQPSKAHIQLAGEIPLVLGNEAGLTQCFSNLLGNAVKFIRPGQKPEVRIRAEVLADRKPAGSEETDPQSPVTWVRISVEDNGIGMPQSMLPRVFDMFSRGHDSSKYEGTGIGLALVRKVVQRMGGRVGVESEPGKGSRFWVELKSGFPRRGLPANLRES